MAAPPASTTSPAGTSPPELGAVVAGYRLEALIERGETGVVYEATKLSSGERAALRLIHPRLSSDPDFRERFQREGRIQTALDHPNIVTVLAVGESEHGLFVATELVRGSRLKDLVAGEDLDAGRAVGIVAQVADALDTVHRAGLIHGDIRSDRILVVPEEGDHAYLTDFGVTEDRHRSGLTGGATADYMAPERIRGEPVTSYADIYAFGAVVYECLSGAVPFPSDSPAAVANAHLADPPPGPSERRPEQLPAEVDGVIAKAMAKNPGDRYETAVEMVQALERALQNAPRQPTAAAAAALSAAGVDSTAAPEAPAEKEVARAAPGRTRYLSWAFAGLAVAALAAAGFFVGRGSSKGEPTPSTPSTIVAGGATFTLPFGWHRLTEVPPMTGVTFPGAVAVAPGKERAKLIAARADGSWPTLLPASFQERVLSESDLLSGRDVVLIGKRQAFRYRGVALSGESGRLTVFVFPVRNGVEMLSCVIPAGAPPRVSRQCEGIAAAAKLRLPASPPYSLVPQASYARAVNEAVDRLNTARQAGRRGLAAAGSPDEQAAAARQLGDAYARELQGLAKQQTESLVASVHRRIVAQLRSVQAAYANLATAALNGDAAAFEAAKRVVRAREAAVKELLLELRFAGITMQ